MYCLSSLSFGVDDTFQTGHIQDCRKLLNGVKIATLGSGTKEPVATAFISANFTVIDDEK